MTSDTPPPADPALLEQALQLTREAGAITLEWYRHDELAVDHKDDGTPVTYADRAAERHLRERIGRAWPDDAILGEEEGSTGGTSGRTWVIDPIDGTKAFTQGVPLYTNLLALVDEHGPAIGVINVPALDEVVFAGRGLGCFTQRPGHDRTDARVGGADRLVDGYVTTSAYRVWDDEVLLDLKNRGVKLRTWGDGYGYVLVATGRCEAMVDPIANAWDLAPVPVIIDEAGGRFTDLTGRPGFDHGSGLATNGAVHEEVLAAFGR